MPTREDEIKMTIAEMREYLAGLKKEHPYILGLLLHGSRLNENKTPGENSDVDSVFILEEGNPTDSDSEAGRRLVEEIVAFTEKHKTASGFAVGANDFYTVSEFLAELKSREIPKNLRGKLIWGSNPAAFKYIGGVLNQLPEDEVNEFLKKEFASPEMAAFKKEIAAKQRL